MVLHHKLKLNEGLLKQFRIKPEHISKQDGSGIFDTLKSAYKLADAVRTLPQRYPDEKHTILKLPDGEFKRARFAGPNTHIAERLKQGILPLTKTDEIAEKHDLDYALARNDDDIRIADKKMISNLHNVQKNNTDSAFNTKQAEIAIKGKMLLEDKLGVSKSSFTSYGLDNTKKDDIPLFKMKQQQLIQKGLGKEREEEMIEYEKTKIKKPAQELYEKLVKKHSKTKRFSKKTKKRYDNIQKLKEQEKESFVPDNIMKAISGMKI